jgi:hypothetical protein
VHLDAFGEEPEADSDPDRVERPAPTDGLVDGDAGVLQRVIAASPR